MRDLCNTDKPLFAVLTKLTYSAYPFPYVIPFAIVSLNV